MLSSPKPLPFSDQPSSRTTLGGGKLCTSPRASPPPLSCFSLAGACSSFSLAGACSSIYLARAYLLFFLSFLVSTKKSPAISYILYVYCEFWQGFWIENLESRSTHLRQSLHATHLSTVIAVILRFHRH
jgi:hypothetical protein